VFHVTQCLALLIIFAMYLSSGKSFENGVFGAIEINSLLAVIIY